ncbi:proton-coupled folate transporter-like [Oppia nitens]|uniref:proton-coupled folate transporter-like n=1 Tax=Oppia nitens TaxID=1686743 RepID=UPI0023D98CA3|nr:proton-coupled folate transporter-like [Oppia nitens]
MSRINNREVKTYSTFPNTTCPTPGTSASTSTMTPTITITKSQSSGISYKLKRFWDFVSLLTVEPYLLAFMFVYTMKGVPTTQLAQDKICRFVYNLPANYCSALPTMTDKDDYLHKKSEILSEGTSFTLYSVVILTIPSVIASLFIGSWTDKYLNAKKVLLIGGALAAICECSLLIINDYCFEISYYYILLSMVPNVFSGSLLAILCAIWSYIASTTPPHMRAIRMTFAEIAMALGTPLGTYLGGIVLNTTPMFSNGQLHNYSGVYAIAGVTYVLALCWTIFMVNEKRDIRLWEQRFRNSCDDNDVEFETRVENKIKRYDDYRHIHPIKLLVNIKNVKEMWSTCAKPRANLVRIQIWLLFLSVSCYMLSHVGPIIFLFQFTQKVYSWNSQMYSNGSAISSFTIALATIIIAPVLIRVFKLKDTTLSLIGLLSYFAQNLIRGVVLTSNGFYYSILPGCLGSVGGIGIKSHFSKIVTPQEIGKVFSCLATIEAITPLIAAGIFTTLFNATINTNPGLALIVVAGLLVIPFTAMIWIHFCTKLPDLSGSSDHPSNDSTIVDDNKFSVNNSINVSNLNDNSCVVKDNTLNQL